MEYMAGAYESVWLCLTIFTSTALNVWTTFNFFSQRQITWSHSYLHQILVLKKIYLSKICAAKVTGMIALDKRLFVDFHVLHLHYVYLVYGLFATTCFFSLFAFSLLLFILLVLFIWTYSPFSFASNALVVYPFTMFANKCWRCRLSVRLFAHPQQFVSYRNH